MATFGKTDIGSLTAGWSAGCTNVCRFELTEDGTVTAISVYNGDSSPTGTVSMAIYDESGGLPNAIVVGPTAPQSAVYEWNTVSGLSVFLSAGFYWIGASWSEGQTLGYKYDVGASGQMQYRLVVFPDPFGTPDGNSNDEVSIYATYTPAAPPPALQPHCYDDVDYR